MPNNTPEQQAIIDYATAHPALSLVVEALAGTGKTTTIIALLAHLRGTTLLAAFNKSIQTELQQRIPAAMQIETQVTTVHALGLGILRKAGKKPKVDGGKLHFLLRNLLDTKPSFASLFGPKRGGAASIVRLVSSAKLAGFGLTSSSTNFPAVNDSFAWERLATHFRLDEEFLDHNIPLSSAIEVAQRLFTDSCKADSMIDFDDMIYFPLLLNLSPTLYTNVIIDEAQDISAIRLELLARCIKPGGRLIAVGDRHQAIYGFTGADAYAMDNITQRFSAHTLPLTICWRCDEEIIKTAQAIVPAIRARPDAAPGNVQNIEQLAILDNLANIPNGSAFLCRLNRPLVAMCLELIRANRPARIEGRDIGQSFLRHVKKAEPLYATTPIPDIILALHNYHALETAKLLRLNKQRALAFLDDEIDGALLLLERCVENKQLSFTAFESLINTLFADNIPAKSTITLSSVHKAKGREWPTVFILGRFDYMPFWMAQSDWEEEQEQNLIYVAVTRAEQSLFLVSGTKEWLDHKSNSPSDPEAILNSPVDSGVTRG